VSNEQNNSATSHFKVACDGSRDTFRRVVRNTVLHKPFEQQIMTLMQIPSIIFECVLLKTVAENGASQDVQTSTNTFRYSKTDYHAFVNIQLAREN